MLCLTFLLHEIFTGKIINYFKMKMIDNNNKVDKLTIEGSDSIVNEMATEMKETPCEIRLVSSYSDYKRRRSSTRVHYKRNVRRIISDCRRAKRLVLKNEC